MTEIGEIKAQVSSEDVFERDILPTLKSEVDRDVEIESSAEVDGNVYGDNVTLEDGSVVGGCVMASSSLSAHNSLVSQDVGTPGRLTAENTVFRGSVSGKKTRLKGCVVWGSVVGTDVYLEDCKVLGIVGGERELELEDVSCYTFKSQTEAVVSNTEIVLPQAIVSGDVELGSQIEVLGLGEIDGGRPTLSQKDIVAQDGEKYLTLAERILNLQKVEDRLDKVNESLREMVVEGVEEQRDNDTTKVKDQRAAAVEQWYDSL